jgi:hypothetical protein
VAMLKGGPVFVLDKNGQISKYRDASTVREKTNDQGQWFEEPDDESKVHFLKLIYPHIPA